MRVTKTFKSCKGCKYLVHASAYDVCKAGDNKGGTRERVDPFTGRVTTHYRLRPTLPEARSEGGICGPDASLYELWWGWKLWNWIRGK